MRETAPRIETIKIPVDKIRDVIGSGGKVVRGIQEETGASIDIQEDGAIHVGATDGASMEAAKDMILGIVKEPEVGEVFEGEVVGIKDFGAFVKLTPQGRPAPHLARGQRPRREGRRRAQPRRHRQGRGSRSGCEDRQDLARSPR